jgi:photosystem II stability/assembly factor-like uncharacterized protein
LLAIAVQILSAAPAMASAWEEIALPEKGRPTVYHLLRAPGNPEVLYATTDQGAWRSVDGGGSWERVGVMRMQQAWPAQGRLLIDAVDPFLLYTFNWNGYIARSRDEGMSWQPLKEAVSLLAADPVRSGRLFGAAQGYGGRLLISEDRGETWSATPVDTVLFVAVNPVYPQYVYSGRGPFYDTTTSHMVPGTLWRSADGGTTWAKSPLAHRLGFDGEIIADPGNPLGLYVADWDTLWHSEDGGDTWKQLWSSQRPDYISYIRLAVDAADPQQLLLIAPPPFESFWRSRDAGRTWEEVAVPYPTYRLVLDPRDPDQYYAVVLRRDTPVSLLHSADAGSHWEDVALPETGPAIGTVVFDRRGQIYAGARRLPAAHSEDWVEYCRASFSVRATDRSGCGRERRGSWQTLVVAASPNRRSSTCSTWMPSNRRSSWRLWGSFVG